MKKNVAFVWTKENEKAFQALKDALITAPVFALPDFTKELEVETDASNRGISVVLMQDKYPIAYLNRALGPRM